VVGPGVAVEGRRACRGLRCGPGQPLRLVESSGLDGLVWVVCSVWVDGGWVWRWWVGNRLVGWLLGLSLLRVHRVLLVTPPPCG